MKWKKKLCFLKQPKDKPLSCIDKKTTKVAEGWIVLVGLVTILRGLTFRLDFKTLLLFTLTNVDLNCLLVVVA